MKASSLPRTALLAGVVVLAVQVLLLATGNRAVLHGTLIDPDCYMHLQRALRLMGHWHQTIDPRINAPYGYAIHWTAVFDLLLVAGAAPLRAFGLDAHTALFLWGIAISPAILIATLAVFAWGVHPRVEGKLFLWLVVLFFTQPQLAGAFLAGRPDHHSLILGLMMMQLAWAYALLDGRTGSRGAIVAGILAGVQIATLIEGLLTILFLAVSIAAVWLVFARNHLRALALYLGTATLTVAAWLWWEGGQYLTAFAYDRPSVVHIVVLASGTAAIAAVALVEHRGLLKTRASKAAALALAALLSAGTIGAICPDFFLGPWPHIDPTIHAWHREISELQPLLPFDARGLSAFFAQLSWAVLALPFVLKRLGSGPADDRPMMLLSLIGFAMFIGLALMQERWAGEVQAVMLLPWTLMTVAIMKSEWSITVGHTRVPLRSAMMSGALLLPVIAALLTGHGKNFSPTPHRDAACDWSAAAAVLRNSVPDNAIVVMPLWPGPEVLWRSNSRVVGAPYEMLPAMKDTAAFMDGSEQTARDVVTRRGISYALVCEPGPGFGGRLAQGMAPAWLAPAALKGGPAGFRLYRVAY